MTKHPPISIDHMLAVLLVISSLVITGCSGDSAGNGETELVVPDRFESDGHTWSRNAVMSDDDVAVLTHFFDVQPELSGSPELNGNPEVFANAAAGRRYYWVSQSGEQISWYCVGYERGQIAFTEGKGTPF